MIEEISPMIIDNRNLLDDLFDGFSDYEKYIKDNALHELVGIDLKSYGDVKAKQLKDPYHRVNQNIDEAYAPELDDLVRLHYLITSRKVTTILEFGVGKSTIIFNDALIRNQQKYEHEIVNDLRRGNPFECHSVDNYEKWIEEVRSKYNLPCVTYHKTEVEMGTFNDRVCTFYSKIPNICPDFIYLDGPDQFSVKGEVRGITTNHPDRLPMTGDVLLLEHFFLPGTLLVSDGRTANARFVKANLQRDWNYCYDEEVDQHYFELSENPLGIYNRRQINFCLGEGYYRRLKAKEIRETK